ncbi:MAG: glycosyltransferase family 4 protein [Acidobacteriales bacterium]|nr:glycosyltransferase family 4 protein [Terriglobales bacterium]
MGRDLQLKILFIVPYAPNRIRTRPYHFIKTLAAQGHRITLASLWTGQQEFQDLKELARDLDCLVAEKMSAARSLWNCARAIPGRGPLQAAYSWNRLLAWRIGQLIEAAQFDIVHVEHLRGVRYGLHLGQSAARCGGRRPAVVWDSVDCISALFRQTARCSAMARSRLAAKVELARTERYEAWLPGQFDRVLVSSEVDRSELLELASNRTCGNGIRRGLPAKRIVVIPNGVDLQYYRPPGEACTPLTLVFTGKMSYHANASAAVHLVKNTMPRIWKTHPETQLWVVGKDPPAEVRQLAEPRIRITGTVPDIRPFLGQATVAVAPIRYGAGIQNKVLEALACGTPVVATPQAVSALQVRSGEDLIVAESEEEFANSVSQLLSDTNRRMSLGCAGRRYVERHHDWRDIATRLTQVYFEATGSRETICEKA